MLKPSLASHLEPMFEKKRNGSAHKRQAGMTLELDVMSVVMGGVLPFTARGGAEAGIRWTPALFLLA